MTCGSSSGRTCEVCRVYVQGEGPPRCEMHVDVPDLLECTDWHSRKPFTVTKEHESLPFGGYPDGRLLRCALCGRFLWEGDTARWIFTNTKGSKVPGNPFVCGACDGPDVITRLEKHVVEAKRYWWANRYEEPRPRPKRKHERAEVDGKDPDTRDSDG